MWIPLTSCIRIWILVRSTKNTVLRDLKYWYSYVCIQYWILYVQYSTSKTYQPLPWSHCVLYPKMDQILHMYLFMKVLYCIEYCTYIMSKPLKNFHPWGAVQSGWWHTYSSTVYQIWSWSSNSSTEIVVLRAHVLCWQFQPRIRIRDENYINFDYRKNKSCFQFSSLVPTKTIPCSSTWTGYIQVFLSNW